MGGKVGSHNLIPAAEHRAHSRGQPPALIPDQPVDGRVQRLGVIPAGPSRAAHPGRPVGTRIFPGEPFGINGPGRGLTAGLGVCLSPGQRLAGETCPLHRIVRHG